MNKSRKIYIGYKSAHGIVSVKSLLTSINVIEVRDIIDKTKVKQLEGESQVINRYEQHNKQQSQDINRYEQQNKQLGSHGLSRLRRLIVNRKRTDRKMNCC